MKARLVVVAALTGLAFTAPTAAAQGANHVLNMGVTRSSNFRAGTSDIVEFRIRVSNDEVS